MDLEKLFGKDLLQQVKRATKTKIINTLLKEYYEDCIDEAQRNPKSFGENSETAEDDPGALARLYAEQYKSVLTKKGKDHLEILYAHHIKDRKEIESESESESEEQ
jgi:hypothetical protein